MLVLVNFSYPLPCHLDAYDYGISAILSNGWSTFL